MGDRVRAGDLLAIACPGGMSAEVNPLGAELSRLITPDGRDLLWDGDPAFWSGRAPVLFPIIGSLRNDHFRWQGQAYSLLRHGFARRMAWVLIKRESDSVTLRLLADDDTRAVYPFEFVLELQFSVSLSALTMAVTVRNAGTGPMPFSFGFHPALRWPFAEGHPREEYQLRFEHAEPGRVARLDAMGLIARTQPSPLVGDTLALDDYLFRDDALVFRGISSRAVGFGVPGGEWLQCTFPEFPDLGVWSKPGAGFLCIEPWLGHADPAGFDGELDTKPGILVLAPDDAWHGTMSIALAGRNA